MQPNIPYFLQCLMINVVSKILVVPALSFGSTTDLPLDMLSSSPLLRYTGYVLVIFPHSCADMIVMRIQIFWTAMVGTVMTST